MLVKMIIIFTQKSHLKRHSLTHEKNAKKFKCNDCIMSFRLNFNLQAHRESTAELNRTIAKNAAKVSLRKATWTRTPNLIKRKSSFLTHVKNTLLYSIIYHVIYRMSITIVRRSLSILFCEVLKMTKQYRNGNVALIIR